MDVWECLLIVVAEMAELIGDDVDAEQLDTKDMINTLLKFL